MDDLDQLLTNIKEILYKGKYEISSIADDNGFEIIGLSEYFENVSDGKLADMANNCSNIEENVYIFLLRYWLSYQRFW